MSSPRPLGNSSRTQIDLAARFQNRSECSRLHSGARTSPMNNQRAVHVATVKRAYKGKPYVTQLLRHTYREDGKVKHLTLGNLPDLPDGLIEVIRKRLAGERLPADGDDLQIVRSLPHGHVATALGTLRKTGLDQIIASKPCREERLVIAMIVLRISASGSKVANLTGRYRVRPSRCGGRAQEGM